jgi:predicted Zn-dependent protease
VRDFAGLVRERKYPSEAAAHYGLAVALARSGDWDGSVGELAEVRRLKVVAPMIDRLEAEVRFARGDRTEALALYRDALARYPMNLPLLYGYGTALLGDRRFSEALRFAEVQLQTHPQDLKLNRVRADAYAGLGRRTQYHLVLAEMSLLKGQTAGALEQLELAQRAGDASFQEMSVVDARMREVKRRQIEELKERERRN